MDKRGGDGAEHATQPEPITSTAVDAPPESGQPASLLRGLLALLAVFVIVQIVPQVAGLRVMRTIERSRPNRTPSASY